MNLNSPPPLDLEELLRPHWNTLRRNLQGMLRASGQRGTREEVDELLSETVTEALPKMDQYNPEKKIVAWLTGFGINILRRRPRQKRRNSRVEYAEILEEQIAPGRNAELRERLEHYLAELSEAEAELLRLAYFKELTGEELAAALGLPSANAASLKKTRALKKLKAVALRSERED